MPASAKIRRLFRPPAAALLLAAGLTGATGAPAHAAGSSLPSLSSSLWDLLSELPDLSGSSLPGDPDPADGDEADGEAAQPTDGTRAVIDDVTGRSYSAVPPVLPDGGAATAIVVFGAAVNGDGSLPPVLVERLSRALEAAEANPSARVVVTGGKVVAGRAEAGHMAGWLIDRGLAADRVVEENASTDTVTNARHVADLLPQLGGVNHAVVVTSGNHLRRAVVDLRLALGEGFTVDAVNADADGRDIVPPVPDWEYRAILRDAALLQG